MANTKPSESNRKRYWTLCLDCLGRGQKNKRIRKKAKLAYQRALLQFEKGGRQGVAPIAPKGHLDSCPSCAGKGLTLSSSPVPINKSYPHIAIIGAGIGGVALAVACLHRGIPFTLYERDNNFSERSQGYGLTLQQASRAIQALGITALEDGVISTRHVVHRTDGQVIGEWGVRRWNTSTSSSTSVNLISPNLISNKASKRTNIHIARQSLRLALLDQLGEDEVVQWGHQLVDLKKQPNDTFSLTFQVAGEMKHVNADLVVGADGVRSSVRRLLIGEDNSPLHYLGCIVILGICALDKLQHLNSTLLDAATVFQTANGHERLYIMPYKKDSVMWQLSFPMHEQDAQALSAQGKVALKQEAIRRCGWHDPIPHILAATQETLISGYPVYDRALLEPEWLQKIGAATLIGDGAHPMSPFKGQGANQALLDALALTRAITRECRSLAHWQEAGVRTSLLAGFEAEMIARTTSKVMGSADAAEFLHSETVLFEGDEPRGRCLKRNS